MDEASLEPAAVDAFSEKALARWLAASPDGIPPRRGPLDAGIPRVLATGERALVVAEGAVDGMVWYPRD